MNLENIVKETLSKNKLKVQEYEQDNSKESLNYLVGIVLQETDGKYSAVEVEKELEAQLESINTTVGYPRQLSIYYRTDETTIAEQLSNKLRGELDVPLESVNIPDRFNVDEIEIKYDIHENGTVEFVRADV